MHGGSNDPMEKGNESDGSTSSSSSSGGNNMQTTGSVEGTVEHSSEQAISFVYPVPPVANVIVPLNKGSGIGGVGKTKGKTY